MKIIKSIKVKNNFGLHIRPAASIVKLLQKTKSHIFFTYKTATINAKSIMGILTLAAKKNAIIKVAIEGEDAKEIMDLLEKNFDDCFGEKKT